MSYFAPACKVAGTDAVSQPSPQTEATSWTQCASQVYAQQPGSVRQINDAQKNPWSQVLLMAAPALQMSCVHVLSAAGGANVRGEAAGKPFTVMVTSPSVSAEKV